MTASIALKSFIQGELSDWKYSEIAFTASVLAGVTVLTVISGDDNIIGLTSAITGILYTLLAGKGKTSCYLFGLVNTILYGTISWNNRIYGDALLNWGYYFPMQIAGMILWLRNRVPGKGTVIKKRMNQKEWLIGGTATVFFWLSLAAVLAVINGKSPLLDSATTTLSVAAMILGVFRRMEQWLCWTLVNSISIVLWLRVYESTGQAMATLLMWTVFLLCGIIFWYQWYCDAENREDTAHDC